MEINDRIIVLRISSSPELFIRTSVPAGADVRLGDLLTLYTEVLQKAN